MAGRCPVAGFPADADTQNASGTISLRMLGNGCCINRLNQVATGVVRRVCGDCNISVCRDLAVVVVERIGINRDSAARQQFGGRRALA